MRRAGCAPDKFARPSRGSPADFLARLQFEIVLFRWSLNIHVSSLVNRIIERVTWSLSL